MSLTVMLTSPRLPTPGTFSTSGYRRLLEAARPHHDHPREGGTLRPPPPSRARACAREEEVGGVRARAADSVGPTLAASSEREESANRC